MSEYNYEEHYDEAIKWTIQEVLDALKDLEPSSLSEQQWQDVYFALEGRDCEEAYQAYLYSFYDPEDYGLNSDGSYRT